MSLVRVCGTGDVAPGGVLSVDVPDSAGTLLPVAVARDSDGGWHAVANECSHQAVALTDGAPDPVDGCMIECWLHGSEFDLRTGEPSGLPATRPIPVYRLEVQGGDVLVDVEAGPSEAADPGSPDTTFVSASGAADPAKES